MNQSISEMKLLVHDHKIKLKQSRESVAVKDNEIEKIASKLRIEQQKSIVFTLKETEFQHCKSKLYHFT